MNNQRRRTSITFVALLVLTIPALQGCAAGTPRDAQLVAMEDDRSFVTWRDRLIAQIKADPTYKRVPLDSEAQGDEFMIWLYDAYRHRVSKEAFSSWMNGQYPGHQHEVAFIVVRLP